jgi:proteasome lid subunit RPN8/RPN11
LTRAALGRFREWADGLSAPAVRPAPAADPPARGAVRYDRLRRVVLTDAVSRTLFDEYAAHRGTDRGAEETGWVLLGHRHADEAVVLATLPAAADRDAGEAHVWITGASHVLASRVVRQADRRLTMLGVVHTHPGSLRHPSRGDLDGDRKWVPNLRGGEGVFAIGTAAGKPGDPRTEVGGHPTPNVQTLGGLRFDWYTLAAGDTSYHPVPVELAIGPDLGGPLRPVWDAVEAHAGRLDSLARRFAQVRFEVADLGGGPGLMATVGLGGPDESVRVLLHEKGVRFFYEAGGEVSLPDLPAGTAPDHGVYLLLAELAARH